MSLLIDHAPGFLAEPRKEPPHYCMDRFERHRAGECAIVLHSNSCFTLEP